MAYRPKFGTKHRDFIYSEARTAAYLAGRGEHPICVHCDRPVTPDDKLWDEAHIGAPKCFGGKAKGIAHRACNQLDNNKVVTPAFAKAERVRKRHLGITGPGLGRHPMPCGRRSQQRKTMGGKVMPRETPAQKWNAFQRKRYFAEVEVDAETGEVQP